MSKMKRRICYCNITYKCNNNCINCISYNVKRHTKREVSIDDYRFFQERFHLNENDIWTISGGEPTMSNSFEQIVAFCSNISPHIILYSNGRNLKRLPEEVLKKIERIIVPIYGDKVSHNKYVNSPMAYDETMMSLKSIISKFPYKIDAKILFNKDDSMELFFNSDEWDFLKNNNTYFSISRVLPSIEKSECPNSIAKNAEKIIAELIKLGKAIRLYDIPLCLFNKKFQDYLSSCHIDGMNYDPVVICGSSEKRYKLFPFHKPTDMFEKCSTCPMLSICSMIMQNYFCPMINGTKITITTE